MPYVDPNGLDALPLEYQLENRRSPRYVDVSNFVNNTSRFRVMRREESRLKEEIVHFAGLHVGSFLNDLRD